MTKKEWLIIIVMYLSFWIYLAIDKYINKVRVEKSLSKEHQRAVDYEINDYVLTVAGIYGKILAIDDSRVTIKVDQNSKIIVNLNSILKKVEE